MDYLITRDDGSQFIFHHGVKGQKHGQRRYQNEDGSLTPEGREHYGVGESKFHGQGGQGYEARQAYKRGEITKEERKQATKAGNIVGKLDNIANLGFGRRIREFRARHSTGITAASTAMAAIGGIAVTALTAATGGTAAAVAIGAQAVGGIIGTGIGTAVGTKVIDPLMLKYGYNSKFNASGRQDSYTPSKNRG